MQNIAIITGANRGLGAAIFNDLFNNKHFDKVISISRNVSKFQKELIADRNERFLLITADLSKLSSSDLIKPLEQFESEIKSVTFINNAGVIHPIGKIGELNEEELVKAIQVNVLAPTVISNFIVKVFKDSKIQIINVTSGAANKSIDGWSIYGSSKAYMESFINALGIQEKSNSNIVVTNVDPGLVDTDMQMDIRNVKVNGFTQQNDFVSFKMEGKLATPAVAAKKIIQKINS